MQLQPISLATPQEIENFQNKLKHIKDTRELKSRLLVATNGQTYLLNDIEKLTNEEVENYSDLYFATLQGTKCSLKDLKSKPNPRNPVIQNVPLANYLIKLQSPSFLNLKTPRCPLTQLPIVFPAITNLEDEFEYDVLTESIAKHHRHPKSNETPYSVEQAIPNIALSQLFKVNYYQLKAKNLITSEQTKSIIEMCHLRLNKASAHTELSYKRALAKDPTLKTKSIIELTRINNDYPQQKNIIETTSARAQRFFIASITIGTVGLAGLLGFAHTIFLAPVGVILGGIGLGLIGIGIIGKQIIKYHYENKLAKLYLAHYKTETAQKHLEHQHKHQCNLRLADERGEIRKFLNDFEEKPKVTDRPNPLNQEVKVSQSKDVIFYGNEKPTTEIKPALESRLGLNI